MNFIILIFYEIILWILFLLSIPKMLYSLVVHKKYRESLLPRLGLRYTVFPKSSFPSIWMHAVSVGETKAMVSLARELKHLFPEYPLIISSVTETGHAEAKRSLPFADEHVYLPFDFMGIVYPIIKKAAPGLVILCESDFWLNFLYYAKKQGASVALVNGKISERSMCRFSLVPFFSQRLFSLIDVLCVQNHLYRSRFIEMGLPLEKIVVTGNLKLDEDYPQLSSREVLDWRQKLGIQPHQLVLTIGSTHAPEEQFFLQILKEIGKHTPELRVILVPRHPERFKDVASLLAQEYVSWVNFTDISRRTGKEQVILMDVMGLLRMCYQLSDFAIVAGSFTPRVGGHNILEPCWYGKPVLFGPHMQMQLELVDLMLQAGAGIQVNPEQVRLTIERWIKSPKERQEIGERGLRLVQDLKGSTKRTLQALNPLLTNLSEMSIPKKML